MKPQDIARIVTVGSPAVSPDGQQVAYVVGRVDLDANRYRSAVWIAPVDGGPPRQVTSGAESDGTPTWSPDGAWLAFTSSRGVDPKGGDRTVTLHLLPVDRPGETVTLATRDEGFEGLVWSPDGHSLAFVSRVRDERYADGEDERAQPPRRIDRLFPRLDSYGWTVDRPQQVFVVPVDGSAVPARLTHDRYDYASPTWSPDGSTIAVTAARQPDFDLEPFNDVWLIDVTAGLAADPDGADAPEPRRLTGTDASYRGLAWEPGGSRIACLRSTENIGYRHTRVALLDADSGAVEVLTEGIDRGFEPFPGTRPPIWAGDGLIASYEDRGTTPVVRLPVSGGASEEITGGRRCFNGYDAAGGTVAYVASGPAEPSELFVLRDGGERQVTRHQTGFRAAVPSIAAEHFTLEAADGTELDAWVMLPPGAAASDVPAQSLPALLNIHGGPHTQYGERWFDEFQLYASAGYVVIFANPRGSTGYSETSARVLISESSTEDPAEGWGPPAHDDLMRVVDAALERYPAIDPGRLGVMGGSYGGYMTSWIIGHTDRFAAACSERAVNNVASLEWSSDAAGYFRFAMGVSHLDDPEAYAALSPITYVRDVTTPVLIIHSENDLRCPVEQSDALFVALRLLGKEVEYVRFPGESHELTRSGSPRHRIQRAEIVLDWFGRKLAK